jgi:NADH-quinone oxidoreductase subunit L
MDYLWLIPVFPLAGFLVLALGSSRLSRTASSIAGVGSVGASAVIVAWTALDSMHRMGGAGYTKTFWTWINVGGLRLDMAFYVDTLTLTMMGVITFVGFLIHVYSMGYMAEDKDYARFFACMNLFVSAMLVLVMAENLPLLYLGWEGVGLCSYLLIGFWYQDKANGYAARKAFVVTRVGDTAMAVGLFILYNQLGTLQIQEAMERALSLWQSGSGMATLAAFLILGGAVGKSAQLPLQTWLPDAMAGPTPVSALIHAATMVTAGVYLVARTHMLFILSPAAMTATAVIGTATLLIAGFSALVQHDIKRVLAYSTISQLGYMFLALGVGAWSAAIFHLVTHAFFKALLFLGAGAVIHALGGEQDMFRMGGLKDRLPLVFWTFLAGAASLAALPLVTAGFYSKDMIIWECYASPFGGLWFWLAAMAGALVTSLYTFRMMWLTFAGPVRTPVHHPPGPSMAVPLVILAALSLCAGFVETPVTLGGIHGFSGFIHSAVPETVMVKSREHLEILFEILAALTALGGIAWASALYRPVYGKTVEKGEARLPRALTRFWFGGWGFDTLYGLLFVKPYLALAHFDKNDVIDRFFRFLAFSTASCGKALSLTQNGKLRTYVWGIGAGAAAVILMVVYL